MLKNILNKRNKKQLVTKPVLYTTTFLLIALCFVPLAISGTCPPDMVSYWKLDETSGTIANDSYDGNHGTVYGAIWTSAGQVNNALSFDGSDDYVEVPDDASLQLSNFTVMAWANATQFGTWRTILAKDNATQTGFWFGYNPDNTLDFKFNGQDGININANTVINEIGWHFLVGVYNGTHLMVYVDGVLDNQPLVYPKMINNAGTLKIGRTDRWGDHYFEGNLDEIAIFNRAVPPSEILSLYNKGVSNVGYCETKTYTLTMQVMGNGSTTKNPDQSQYENGSIVEVTALADPGWMFDHWQGDLSGSENPKNITMDSDKTIIACFTMIENNGNGNENTLSINIVGNGSVTRNPNQSTYPYGTVVTLTALADPGWTFHQWSGDLTGDNSTMLINMTSNKTVQAFFTQNEEPAQSSSTTTHSSQHHIRDISPVANANGPYYAAINQDIQFDGSKSYDPDGIIIHYSWSFGDGETEVGEQVTHHYAHAGIYPVTLTVTDNLGVSKTDGTTASIIVPNTPPTNPLIAGPMNGTKNTDYSYAFGSTDADNDNITYIITWGDGSTFKTGALPNGQYFSMIHHWDAKGEYTITATASDGTSTSSSELVVAIHDTLIVNNIAIIALGILALIALIAALLYSKKKKKSE